MRFINLKSKFLMKKIVYGARFQRHQLFWTRKFVYISIKKKFRLLRSLILDLIATVDKINDNILKLKWRSLNSFGYSISLYKISIAVDDGKFVEIEEAQEALFEFSK
jgi:hypothetical protein